MKVEVALTGRPEINLALIFEDAGKTQLAIYLIQRASVGTPPVRVEIGHVQKTDIKRLARSC